jgi:hypothetical protein
MLIFDYSQLCHSAIYQFEDDFRNENEDVVNLFRHSILSTIKFYKKKFREYANEIVIACDGRKYWRKDIFPHYKFKRKKGREDRNLPWDKIFAAMDQIIIEIDDHFHYKVIKHDKAEADDVMAILVEDIANHRMIQTGLETEPEMVMLISTDKDMAQLQKYTNVKQYSPMTSKMIALETSPKEFLRRLILKGDANDGVPGIFSPEDTFVIGKRQPPHTEKKLAPFLAAENMLDAAETDEIRNRIIMNTRLISFAAIPKYLRDDVVKEYSVPVKGNKVKAYEYLANHNCKMLMEAIEDF